MDFILDESERTANSSSAGVSSGGFGVFDLNGNQISTPSAKYCKGGGKGKRSGHGGRSEDAGVGVEPFAGCARLFFC